MAFDIGLGVLDAERTARDRSLESFSIEDAKLPKEKLFRAPMEKTGVLVRYGQRQERLSALARRETGTCKGPNADRDERRGSSRRKDRINLRTIGAMHVWAA